jgi:hypothetical protein
MPPNVTLITGSLTGGMVKRFLKSPPKSNVNKRMKIFFK